MTKEAKEAKKTKDSKSPEEIKESVRNARVNLTWDFMKALVSAVRYNDQRVIEQLDTELDAHYRARCKQLSEDIQDDEKQD